MPSIPKECDRPADDDDVDMLADTQAPEPLDSSSSNSGSSSGGITTADTIISSLPPRVDPPEEASAEDNCWACRNADEPIVECVKQRDLAGLRCLSHQGGRVRSADPLICCLEHDDPTDFIRFLVVEFGADVNQARADGTTALLMAAQAGNLTMVRCLVGEYGAAVSQDADIGAFPLLMAAKNGHLNVLRCLVEFGANVNQASKVDKRTCLSRACTAGDYNVVCCLIELKADVNQAVTNGNTPVAFAVENGHLDVLRNLIEFGADGAEALLVSAHSGRLEMLRYLVLELGVDVGHANHDGFFPLIIAAKFKRLDVLRCLVNELGADVNQASSVDGMTSLWVACGFGALDVVKCLVEELRADVNKSIDDGYSPIFAAALNGHTDVLCCLLKSGADRQQALYVAVPLGHVALVQLLVNMFGAEIINQAMKHGKTPLNSAAMNGNLDMVRCLVELGADINDANVDGNTPLIAAAMYDYIDTVRYLHKVGADVNKGDENVDGTTALIYASTKGYLDMVRCLVELGAEVNRGNETGFTPLIAAASKVNLDMVRCLHELWADVNKGDRNGNTALIYASLHGELDLVRCLIALGAAVNQGNETGQTPLIAAAKKGNLDLVRCLENFGADIGHVDSAGDTALLLSASYGHYQTVQFLLEEGGANANEITSDGHTVWDVLTGHIERGIAADVEEANPLALTALLRVMVLREDPPPALIALLSPDNMHVVQEGARLRARLPAYLVRQYALLDTTCPVLLPPLCALVHLYMELTTEEIWATGLGTAP